MKTTTPVYLTNVNGRGDEQQAKSRFASRNAVSPPRTCPARGRRSLVRSVAGRALLVTALLAMMAVWVLPAGGKAYAVVAPDSGLGLSGNVLNPVADGLDDIIDILKQLEKDLSKAGELVGQGAGRPTAPSTLTLAYYLDDAEDLIDQVFDPMVDPNLDPVDAGAIDPSVTPVTLPQYADQCLSLAEQAVDEAEFGYMPDNDVIGTKLKTIKACLPGYRAAASL